MTINTSNHLLVTIISVIIIDHNCWSSEKRDVFAKNQINETFQVAQMEIDVEDEEMKEIIRRYNIHEAVDCQDPNGNTPLSEAAGG